MTTPPATIQPMMKGPVQLLPGALQACQDLVAAARRGDVPETTLELVHLRVSQINGCSFCVDLSKKAIETGESLERLLAVSAWRDAPYFTEAERAALALAEAVTRLADRED